MYSYGPPHMAEQKQDDQLEHTYSSYVRIGDVAQKTCQRRWTIGKSGKRGSGISVLPARHDDDECIHKTRNIQYFLAAQPQMPWATTRLSFCDRPQWMKWGRSNTAVHLAESWLLPWIYAVKASIKEIVFFSLCTHTHTHKSKELKKMISLPNDPWVF